MTILRIVHESIEQHNDIDIFHFRIPLYFNNANTNEQSIEDTFGLFCNLGIIRNTRWNISQFIITEYIYKYILLASL